MRYLQTIFRFGWPYLRRYWQRLALGVLLGVIFGISNTLILGGASTIFTRLDPSKVGKPEVTTKTQPSSSLKIFDQFKERTDAWKARINEGLDPWLPRADRPMDGRQRAGILLLIPLLIAFRGFVGYFSSYCLGWVSERVINDLRLDVLIKLNSLSLDFFNRSTMGDLLTRVNSDTAQLLRTLNLGFSDLIKEPITVVCMLGALFYLDWQMTLFVLVFFPVCLIPVIILGRKVRRASLGGVKANISQASLLVELINSIRVVKAFNLEDQQTNRYRTFSRDLIHHGMKGIQARELVNPVIETIAAAGLGILMIWIVSHGRSMGDMFVFLVAVGAIYTPVKKLAALHVLFEQASVGVTRLQHILNEQPSVKESPQPRAIADFQSAIVFENITFSYGDRKPVLTNLNLTVPRGMKLGIAGGTGSGKSTLINLIFRFYDPTSGRVVIDGVDLRDLSIRDLRQVMALVSQDVVVFDQTAAENIACGRPGATRAEVEAAARAAFAHDFIRKLPQGYDTRLGERGVTLSGGQRQRLTIARAFIRNAPILVLDEATGSLDSETEAEVQAAIDRLAENRTVISVAHRLSTLVTCDRIIVLTEEGVVESGTFKELLKKNGTFAEMARKQGILLASTAL